jgi:recA bacterial DNA recombination protein
LARQMSTAAELAPSRAPELVSSGVAALDALAGGLPRGAMTQVTGGLSSGRTSLLLAALAAATRRGEVCALIDVMDCFDPHSAEAAGVELVQVLWVRCNGVLPQRQETAPRFAANDFGGHDFVAAPARKRSRREQRLAPLYDRLEQALRAVDLLLQGGGFGLVVLDIAGLPAEVARRVPMTSWFRFRKAVENTPTSLLVVGGEELTAGELSGANPCAALAVRLKRAEIMRDEVEGTREVPSFARLLRGLEIEMELLRSPGERKKPARSCRFAAERNSLERGR